MGTIKKNMTIKKSIVLVFIISMLMTIVAIGYLIFSNWFYSVRHMTENITKDVSEGIYKQIYSFMEVPLHIIQANKGAFERALLI